MYNKKFRVRANFYLKDILVFYYMRFIKKNYYLIKEIFFSSNGIFFEFILEKKIRLNLFRNFSYKVLGNLFLYNFNISYKL